MNFKILAPVAAVGAAFGVVAYWVVRKKPSVLGAPVPAAPLPTPEPDRAAMLVPTFTSGEPTSALNMDLAGVFDGESAPESVAPTAQPSIKAPPLVSADDAEALEADQLGQDWLARATLSERSASESDLELDLNELPDGSEPPDEAAPDSRETPSESRDTLIGQ